jgi:hypothetical protein
LEKLLECLFQEPVVLQVGKAYPMGPIGELFLLVQKNKAGQWMENNQTDPMIRVKNMPSVISKGKDQQLERSIKELLKDVQK